MERNHGFRRAILPAGLLLLLCACSPAARTLGDPERPYPLERPPKVGEILHLPTGLLVTASQMEEVATDARVVYVGETHDNPASHRLELRILEAMHRRYPGQTALAMEMFTPDQQEALDRWVSGELTEKEFLRSAGWYSQWRMDFGFYRPLLEFARREGIRVLGINADKPLVRTVGSTPLEELPAEQRERVPQMDFSDPYQQALVTSIYGGHGESRGGAEGFLRVQTLWDETMAENIAGYLQAPGNEKSRLVVVAGGNHVRFGFGIPRRVFRRIPASYALVGLKEIEIPEERKDRQMDVTLPEFPMPAYDFLLFARYELPETEPVRLGVLLGTTEAGVAIEKVLPGSAAESAGLKGEDLILAFDGEPVVEIFDVIYAVHQKGPGDRAILTLRRAGEEREVEVAFPDKEERKE